jgi:hypothetical protein
MLHTTRAGVAVADDVIQPVIFRMGIAGGGVDGETATDDGFCFNFKSVDGCIAGIDYGR